MVDDSINKHYLFNGNYSVGYVHKVFTFFDNDDKIKEKRRIKQMEIELRFKRDDIETKQLLKKEFGLLDSSFIENRPIDGNTIFLIVLVAVDILASNPKVIDIFLKRDGCEIEFDEKGNLLRAKGYSVNDIIKILSHQKQGAK